jgi:hypothetical protein
MLALAWVLISAAAAVALTGEYSLGALLFFSPGWALEIYSDFLRPRRKSLHNSRDDYWDRQAHGRRATVFDATSQRPIHGSEADACCGLLRPACVQYNAS